MRPMPPGHEQARWVCKTILRKWADPDRHRRGLPPDEVLEGEGNLLTTAGATRLWEALTGTAITAFSNANARLGVGDGAAAADPAQTDLQGTNKFRKGMDATYPQVAGDMVTFRATFGDAEANFAWNEWGVFNAAAGGDMLNRKVQALGTKASPAVWEFTVNLTLA